MGTINDMTASIRRISNGQDPLGKPNDPPAERDGHNGLPGGGGGMPGGGLNKPKKKPSEENAPNPPNLTQEQIDQLVDLYQKRRSLQQSLIKDFAIWEGATAQMLFEIDFESLVKDYQRANRNLGISFQQMPLTWAMLSFTPKADPTGQLPAVLSSDIPGILMPSTQDPDPKITKNGEKVDFNGSLSGEVRLSLLGACPLRLKSTNTLPTNIPASRLAAALTANMTFGYEMRVQRRISVEFKLGELAKQIRKMSTSGGFFKTESLSSLLNLSSTTAWFKYDSDCNDARICEVENAQTIMERKSFAIDQVMQSLARVQVENPIQRVDSAPPGKSGVAVGSDFLKSKDCMFKYCRIGAAVLDVVDAVVGGSSRYDNYVKQNDSWVKDEWNQNKMVEYKGTLGFSSSIF